MELSEAIPFQTEAQRELERQWGVLIAGRARGPALVQAQGIRGIVRESWHRSADSEVRPDLASAPVVLDEDQVQVAAERSDWLDIALRAVARHQESFGGIGHILTLFDHEARMLSCEGDPAALEGLAEINFRPGGLWAEPVVGTNGPGTALATGAPAHIVGAEHFCERWQRWHCAAVPIRDPATARIAGVLDISGFREYAHPHTLNLALALVVAIEQTLAAREVERRYLTLQRFTDLAARYPGDLVLAVDRGGSVVGSTPSLSPALADSLAATLRQARNGLSSETAMPIQIGECRPAVWFPVVHGQTVVGGCLVLEGGAPATGSEGIPFRPGEVRVYARRFFEAGARDLGRPEVTVEPAVYDALQAYHWPGNVRELKQVIRRVLLAAGRRVRLADLPQGIRQAHLGSGDAATSAIDREDAALMQAVQESRTHGRGRRPARHHAQYAVPAHGPVRAHAQAGGAAPLTRAECSRPPRRSRLLCPGDHPSRRARSLRRAPRRGLPALHSLSAGPDPRHHGAGGGGGLAASTRSPMIRSRSAWSAWRRRCRSSASRCRRGRSPTGSTGAGCASPRCGAHRVQRGALCG